MISNNNSVIVVRSHFTREKLPAAPRCVTVIPDVRKSYDQNLNSVYKVVGEIDVNNYINSFAPGCCLKDILQRCSLLPTNAKIQYLNQTPDGVSADLTNIPKSGTEAFIMLQKLKESHPDIFLKFAAGESFDSIVKSILPDQTPSDPISNNSSEVTDNG